MELLPNQHHLDSYSHCRDIGLAVNTMKAKYMEVKCHQGMIVNEHFRIDSNSYEKVKTFKYLGSLVTNQNSVQEKIKFRCKTENSRHYTVQALLFFLTSL